MSVRAYIVYTELSENNFTIKRNFNDEELKCVERITYESTEPLFNIWRHPLFFEVMVNYGDDYTNRDCVGEVYIDKDNWYEALENMDKDTYKTMTLYDNGFGKEIFDNIDKWFKDHDSLTISCY